MNRATLNFIFILHRPSTLAFRTVDFLELTLISNFLELWLEAGVSLLSESFGKLSQALENKMYA